MGLFQLDTLRSNGPQAQSEIKGLIFFNFFFIFFYYMLQKLITYVSYYYPILFLVTHISNIISRVKVNSTRVLSLASTIHTSCWFTWRQIHSRKERKESQTIKGNNNDKWTTKDIKRTL